MQMDWSQLDLVVFAKDAPTAKGLVYLPTDKVLRELSLSKTGNTFKLANDPLGGKVNWSVKLPSDQR
jgi:alpha-D-xyloside xylohydrolase